MMTKLWKSHLSHSTTAYFRMEEIVVKVKLQLLRLVPTADKTITIILQINDYNEAHNIYISSKNLLMFTLRNRAIIVTQNLLS